MGNEKLRPSEINITGPELISLFASKDFVRKTDGIVKKLFSTEKPIEIAFEILRAFDSPKYTYVDHDIVDPHLTGVSKRLRQKLSNLSKKKLHLATLEFHPTKGDSGIYPSLFYSVSFEDLQSLHYDVTESYKYHPLHMTGILIAESREVSKTPPYRIEMLIIRETDFSPKSASTRRQIVNEMRLAISKRDLVDTLRDNGYKAGFIAWRPRGLSSEDNFLLSSFGFTAKRIK